MAVLQHTSAIVLSVKVEVDDFDVKMINSEEGAAHGTASPEA